MSMRGYEDQVWKERQALPPEERDDDPAYTPWPELQRKEREQQ